jgi:hypothetical protein
MLDPRLGSFIMGSITEQLYVPTIDWGRSYSAPCGAPALTSLQSADRGGLAVFAPTKQVGADLAGSYVNGRPGFPSLALAPPLISSSNNTIALQPVSVQGQTGLSVAAGVAGLELRASR